MKELILDVFPSGSCESLHMDEFDLGFLGKKKVSRASEIFFNEDTQMWDVHLPNQQVSFAAASGFESYDIARSFEVAWLQLCRKNRVDPNTEIGEDYAVDLRHAA